MISTHPTVAPRQSGNGKGKGQTPDDPLHDLCCIGKPRRYEVVQARRGYQPRTQAARLPVHDLQTVIERLVLDDPRRYAKLARDHTDAKRGEAGARILADILDRGE
jgi:hypothetical protein